jgi:phosphate butyryltransferase
MIKTLEDIVSAARARGRKRLIVAYGQDSHTLEAVSDAVDMELVDATLVGDPQQIEKVCKADGLDINKFEILPEADDMKAVDRAVKMVGERQGDVLMKGLVSTDKYMRGILNKEYGLVPPKGVLSHICVFEMPQLDRILLVSDVAIIPYPDLAQKTKMVGYLIDTARALGIERPRVACIAPSELLLPGVTSSVEASILAKMADRGQFGDADVDGPLAIDVAVFEETAKLKKVQGSSVAGRADCMLFPNLDAANAFFKTATHFCGGELAGIVTGTKVPCVLTSRADTRRSKLSSIALGCILAK